MSDSMFGRRRRRSGHGLVPARCAAWAILLSAVAGSACSSDSGTAPVTPASIRFAGLASAVVAGEPFDVRVELLDAAGNVLAGARAVVTLSLPGGQPVSGPTVVESVDGVALFPDVALTTAGNDFRLQASGGGRTIESGFVDVAPAHASGARSQFTPFARALDENVPVLVSFAFRDAFGNAVADAPVTLTSSLAGSVIAPASGVTDGDGIFTSSFRAITSGTATISATVDGAAFTFAEPFVATVRCSATAFTIPSQVSGSLPGPACDVGGRPAVVYRFTLGAQSGIAFTTTAAFNARVEVKTALDEQNVVFMPTAGVPTIEWLLPAGTYLYRLRAFSGQGGYTIGAAMVPANAGPIVRALVRGGTYTGQSLAANDRDFGDGTVYDHFFISSPRPCTITMRSTTFNTFLWIEDALAQSFIDADDNDGGGTDAQVILPECSVNGNPIGILANSNPAGPAFGSYTLIVQIANEPPFALRAEARDGAAPLDPARPVVVPPAGVARDFSGYVARWRALGGGR